MRASCPASCVCSPDIDFSWAAFSQPESSVAPVQLLSVPNSREGIWLVGHIEPGKPDSFSFTGVRLVECSDGRTWVSWCGGCKTGSLSDVYSGCDFKDHKGTLEEGRGGWAGAPSCTLGRACGVLDGSFGIAQACSSPALPPAVPPILPYSAILLFKWCPSSLYVVLQWRRSRSAAIPACAPALRLSCTRTVAAVAAAGAAQ